MRKFCLISLYLVLSCLIGINGQSGYKETGKTLERLFNRMSLSYNDGEKKLLNDTIVSLVHDYVITDSVFYHRFNNIRFLGQITSSDSLIKIVTWNVAFSQGLQHYYCYIISRLSDTGRITTYNLSAASGTEVIRKDTTYSHDDWYGSLYYDIRPFLIDDKTYYIIIGLDFKDLFINRKVIEILSFGDEGKLVLGKLCFETENKLNYREVFEYSSKAGMVLRFDSERKIVFDHLSPFSPEFQDNFQYYGPDFSYDSYSFENNKWLFKKDIDVRNEE